MNENLNLVEILKDCPKGILFYSPVYEYVELVSVSLVKDEKYPIKIKNRYGTTDGITKDGRIWEDFHGECMLFPSKEQRDWSKFKVKSNKPKFDPKTLKPYDKVLARDGDLGNWKNVFFSYIIERETCYPYLCLYDHYKYCIPYNDDTKHLVGTTDEAPLYYRYWED